MLFNRVLSSTVRRSLRPSTSLFRMSMRSMSLVSTEAPKMYGETGNLAQGLFEIAAKSPKEVNMVSIRTELEQFSELMTNDDFSQLVKDETKDNAEKCKAIDVFYTNDKGDKANFSISPFTKEFLYMLVEHGQIENVEEISDNFNALYAHSRKETEATVTTAEPLNAGQASKLTKKILTLLPANYKVNLKQEVDASILGGMVVKIAGSAVDLSVASAINTYESRLSEPTSA